MISIFLCKSVSPVYYTRRAVNEPNLQRTVHESFGGKFVYVRSIIKWTNTSKNIPFVKIKNRGCFVRLRSQTFGYVVAEARRVRERRLLCCCGIGMGWCL
uniref:Uncharacterized protein n=1 Tax=Helianthus annuus TaxID=4232 RepID=A0A251SK57_HELAN